MVWLNVIETDEGLEVCAISFSREQARLRGSSERGRLVELDADACKALAEQHGIVVDENGEGPDEIDTTCILPDVWS